MKYYHQDDILCLSLSKLFQITVGKLCLIYDETTEHRNGSVEVSGNTVGELK